MMKLRRRPLSVYNASPDSNSQTSISDRPARKRQRKISTQSISDYEENESDLENQSPVVISDGRFCFQRLLEFRLIGFRIRR